MAITSADIHNQSFSIDRKGYDVDEVDVFLEHVADEIDAMTAQIDQLERQLDDSSFAGFDTPARIEDVPAPVAAASDEELAAKDARIADLERQLEAKKADDNAIAQALIIAQRSADEIISNANATAAGTINDAEDEAKRIVDKAEAEKQKDATRKLAEIGGEIPTPSLPTSAHARVAETTVEATGRVMTSPAQAPINVDGTAAYAMPQTGAVSVAPATPTPSRVEKDLSGFGDADDAFEFEEID